MRKAMTQKNDYEFIRGYVSAYLGIQPSEKLRPLTRAKLSEFSKKYQVLDWLTFLNKLKDNPSDKINEDFVDIFVVGHTSFLRNRKQFDLFKKLVLPDILNNQQKDKSIDLRIWSAGCSTGEEPYSIIISLMQYFGEKYSSITGGVLATDISEKSLDYARIGKYSNSKVGAKIKQYISPYIRDVNDHSFEIKKHVRKECTFRKFNLIERRYPFKDKFHTIFCRNVLFYFNDAYRHQVQSKIVDSLYTGGYLFLGDAEKFNFDVYGLSRIGNGVYKK